MRSGHHVAPNRERVMMASRSASRLGHAAARYAAHGWHVFPLAPRAKEPLGGRGFKDASADITAVRAWWDRHPNANIGLCPGASGLVVLDVDGPRGEATAHRLGVDQIVTLTCRTGRVDGGAHRYFRHPGGSIGNRVLGDHLDVRADAGYVVVPPSVHPTGAVYAWEDPGVPVATLPTRVVEALRSVEAVPSATRYAAPSPALTDALLEKRIAAYLARLPSALGDGDGRNAVAFRIGAALTHDFARPLGEALAWAHAWNVRNHTPLPARELERAVQNGADYGARPFGEKLA